MFLDNFQPRGSNSTIQQKQKGLGSRDKGGNF